MSSSAHELEQALHDRGLFISRCHVSALIVEDAKMHLLAAARLLMNAVPWVSMCAISSM